MHAFVDRDLSLRSAAPTAVALAAALLFQELHIRGLFSKARFFNAIRPALPFGI
jgi:hypothetical protein